MLCKSVCCTSLHFKVSFRISSKFFSPKLFNKNKIKFFPNSPVASKQNEPNYKDYQLLINNIYETGDYTQLLTEPITLFQETSGTTGAIKLIPRTSSLSQSF
ncbi:GH3 auxin-responsive promoter family protein [Chroococcidiopsis cubana]|uniref:GH3 family domain-containing protein n=1 Tax=Chroococcidiopsis cubana TaxID=171392 RepID=UPI0038FCCE96